MAWLVNAEALVEKKTVLWDQALGFCDCVLVSDIEAAPSAVTLCKDCALKEPSDIKGKVWCRRMGRYMKLDGFCSEGVSKE